MDELPKPRQILQLGYVCGSLERAVDYFVEKQGAGPFYAMDIPAGAARYNFRGTQIDSVCKNRVAFGYRGKLQFELIETDNPVFDHLRGERDIIYHHCMQMSDTFDTDVEKYAAAGFATMGTAEMSGVLIHYIDTLSALGHYTELFDYRRAIEETDGAMFRLFSLMQRASVDWNGRRRMRLIVDLDP